MDPLPENRSFPRMTVNHEIAWRPARAPLSETRVGIARNISGNGVLIEVTERPEIGEQMELRINGGALSLPALDVLVEVVRVHESSPLSCEVGARIVAMR